MAIQFKVDEDLPQGVADALREAGFDTRTVIEQSLGGASDEDLWPIVQRENRCLVTADKGFANALQRPPGTHAGIVLLRLPRESRRGYSDLARRLVQSGKAGEVSGAIAVVSPDAIRIHR